MNNLLTDEQIMEEAKKLFVGKEMTMIVTSATFQDKNYEVFEEEPSDPVNIDAHAFARDVGKSLSILPPNSMQTCQFDTQRMTFCLEKSSSDKCKIVSISIG